MDLQQFTAFMVFAFTATMTPGPNNLMLMMSGNLFGWRRTLPHMIGIISGFALMLVCAVYGLTLILERLPWLTWTVRLIGTAWLGWLGVKFILGALKEEQDGGSAKISAARPLRFYEAVLFQWANPKSLIVSSSSASAFIALAPTSAERASIIAGGFSLAGLVSTNSWTLAGSAIAKVLTAGRHAKASQIIMGLLLLVTALSLLFL